MIKKIKTLTLLLFIAFGQFLYGQTTFNYHNDFKSILEKTKDPKSELFYDNLQKRFFVNDTTLTDHQVLALLIGYTNKSEYKPYKDIHKEREIYDLNDENNYQKALDEGLKFIKSHPFSVKTLFEIAYSYHKLGDEGKAEHYAYKGYRIFEAMYYSGNGTTPETPTFALGPADGQDFIRKFVKAKIGTMGSGRDKNNNFLDILEAKLSDKQTITLYFIIQHATSKMFD
ncbi:DUF4919 domain-containing protein [Flavobacterium pedocola]